MCEAVCRAVLGFETVCESQFANALFAAEEQCLFCDLRGIFCKENSIRNRDCGAVDCEVVTEIARHVLTKLNVAVQSEFGAACRVVSQTRIVVCIETCNGRADSPVSVIADRSRRIECDELSRRIIFSRVCVGRKAGFRTFCIESVIECVAGCVDFNRGTVRLDEVRGAAYADNAVLADSDFRHRA